MFNDLLYRLRSLFRRDAVEAELDDEMRFHLEQQANKIAQANLAPAEAARQARLAFGAPDAIREEHRDARGTRLLDDLRQDVRYALRTLFQRPGFALIALSTLALGIGATTVLFSVINSVLLTPLDFPQPDRLFTMHERTDQDGEHAGTAYLNFFDLRAQSHALAMGAWMYGGGTVTEPGPAERVDGREISAGLFAIFGKPLARGREFTPDDDRPGGAPVAIISPALWQHHFGGRAEAIGSRIVFEGTPYTVVGVAPDMVPPDSPADIFIPLGQNPAGRMRNRGARFLRVISRLAPDKTPAAAQAELSLNGATLVRQYKDNAGRDFLIRPLDDEITGGTRSTLWLLLGAVGLVLLIACVNVASLLLARSVSRDREWAMRIALGAGRGRLVRQCLTESAILGLSGGLLGTLLASAALQRFIALWPGGLPRAAEISIDWRVLTFIVVISLVSGILAGMAPVLRVRLQAMDGLRAGGRSVAGGTRRLHSGFVAVQIALAVVLLVGAGILGRTMLRLVQTNPGFQSQNVIAARVALTPGLQETPAQIRAAWQNLLDTVRHTPGVRSAAISDIIPMRTGLNALPYSNSATLPPADRMPSAIASGVTSGYWQTMGIPLRAGRLFDERDRLNSQPVVVIDESLARHAFGEHNPVGEHLWSPALGREPVLVVGVVGHVRHWGLAEDAQSNLRDQLYYPFDQLPDQLMRLFSTFQSITIRTSAPPNRVLGTLRSQLASGGRATFYEVHTMEELTSASIERQRFLLLLFGIFSLVALLLACIGIYGVVAYLNSQRVPEFGVRMALGAAASDVLRLVLGESVGMILAGVAIGTVGAYAAVGFLKGLVQGVQSSEPLAFAAMVALLAAATLTASFIPALRASRIAPSAALRKE